MGLNNLCIINRDYNVFYENWVGHFQYIEPDLKHIIGHTEAIRM